MCGIWSKPIALALTGAALAFVVAGVLVDLLTPHTRLATILISAGAVLGILNGLFAIRYRRSSPFGKPFDGVDRENTHLF